MYRLSGVVKRYPHGRTTVDALRGIDLTIESGDQLVIQGPTGGGKTTLLQMLGGLDRPTAGTIELDGVELSTLSEAKLTSVRAQNVGFVFQTFNLIPTLTALENVETALVPMRLPATVRRSRATAAIESVGLTERRSHLPGELSGGQQQRVAIARALVKQPRVLLADEPTGNLDEETRDDIIELLDGLWRDNGLTFVLVTHDSTIARRFPRLATIRNGQIEVSDRTPAT